MIVLPLVLNEQLVCLFRFWHNEQACEGMRYDNELYALVRTFPAQERLQAYALANELAETGALACVTCSTHRYAIWMGLRSPSLSAVPQAHPSPEASLSVARARNLVKTHE